MFRKIILLICSLLVFASVTACRSIQYTLAPAATFSVQPINLAQDEETLQSILHILEKRMMVGLNGNAKVGRDGSIFKISILKNDDLDAAIMLATNLGYLSFVDSEEAIPTGSIVSQTDQIILTNEQFESAEWDTSISDTPQLILYLTKDGETRFSDYTKSNGGRYLAIAIDNVVIYCPQITMQIPGNVFVITGPDVDNQLAYLIPGFLSASPLPMPLEVVREN